MALQSGSRIGSYQILNPLGAGGMGEVYRAHDSELGREVALKTLPEAFVADPERVARFEREARILATLNHPNIATLYGFERQDGVLALVMELVEGETLHQRLQGPASAGRGLPLPEVIAITRQIVDALDAAHEKGIVHRDLKPANIKLTPDGLVKVLDFGLAKAVVAAESGGHQTETRTLSPAETKPNAVMGTAAYMSPEQARGLPLDRRTDIWAFGCVLFEMLAGHPAFARSTSSDTLAAVLTAEIDWAALPATLPPAMRQLLGRCLERTTKARLRDIGDARPYLDDPMAPVAPAATPDAGSRWGWPRRLAVAGAVLAIGAMGVLASQRLRRPTAEPRADVMQMTVLLPPGITVARGPAMLKSLALSPDGRTLVVAGSGADGQRLYVRNLGRLEATPLAGTDGASCPFFSPDGAWIGFFADRRLKRMPAGGGTPIEIAAAPGFPAGASWAGDGRIVFASGYNSPLRIVDASGGTPSPLTTLDAGLGHLYPELLPDGRTVLFNEGRWIHALDLSNGRRRGRVTEGAGARLAPNGHLLVGRQGVLLALPFDATRLEVNGPAVPVVEAVAVERGAGGAPHVAVSRGGTVAYAPGGRTFALVVVSPGGAERVVVEDAMLENPRFSPDGRRLVVARTRRVGDAPDLWIYDLSANGAPEFRLTFDGGRAPVWTRDGAAVTFSVPVPSERAGIYTKVADGRDEAQGLLRLANFHWLVGWTPERTLGYGLMENPTSDGVTSSSVLAFDKQSSRHVVGPSDTWGGRLSPDGKLLAYYTLDSGYFEIYVTPFPGSGPRWLIGEGTDPAWAPDGSEIFYRNGSRLMAARVDVTSGVRVVSRRLVVEPFVPPLYDDYDIHPDGRTVALVRPVGDAGGREVVVMVNWAPEGSVPVR